jgi:hypothetical protein
MTGVRTVSLLRLHEVVVAIFLSRAFFEGFLGEKILVPLGLFLVRPFLLLLR